MVTEFKRYDKYLVLKLTDIDECLNNEQKKWLENIEYSIESYRLANKKKDNHYVVVNEDQPYAEQVWALIKEQWEKDNG